MGLNYLQVFLPSTSSHSPYIFLLILLMKHCTSGTVFICLNLAKGVLKLKRLEATIKYICIRDISGY